MEKATTTDERSRRVHKGSQNTRGSGQSSRQDSPRGTIVHYPPFEPYRRETEPTCMCLEGLLPQHIRNIIMAADIEAITVALNSYQDAINASSTEQVMKLYAPDGVFMAQNFPTANGTEEVRKMYDEIFSSISLHVKFDIIEVVPTAPNWAFARTSSAGTTTVLAGGGGQEANQELFILQKLGGEWKIARYCFSTTLPPH